MRRSAFDTCVLRRAASNGQFEKQYGSRAYAVVHLATVCLWSACMLLASSGCFKKTSPAHLSASPRLHLVALMYGKYMSAHQGEMPADEQEFVSYIDTNEREVLQRYGLRS